VKQITAPHFVAGIVLDWRRIVVEAAPIVNYMKGWTEERMEDYCASKGWVVYAID
jgi:hypothetical protein